MSNPKLKKVWKSRINLRTKAKKLKIELDDKEIQSLDINLESINIEKKIEYENGTFKSEKDRALSNYSIACHNYSIRLKEERIKRSKEVIDYIIKSDIIWINSIIKIYGNIGIEWFYNPKKKDYECRLENGEMYFP